ncbi:putative beta-1,4-xylosyltransferase IRX14-like [Capsicum annuum]|nr:putative beta-1,4-xylosyltransferase IRX14-like [Capsicum annuum]
MANTNLILSFHVGPLHIEWERIHKEKEQGTKGLKDLKLYFRAECKKEIEEAIASINEDSNGAIDSQELKHSFSKQEINFTDEEISNLFQSCDINEDMGIKFSEFIILLCLVYLLKGDPSALHAVSRDMLGPHAHPRNRGIKHIGFQPLCTGVMMNLGYRCMPYDSHDAIVPWGQWLLGAPVPWGRWCPMPGAYGPWWLGALFTYAIYVILKY